MRRPRRTQPDATLPLAAARPGDAERIVWLLVSEAQAQRALLAANSDMHDVKALGLLGLDGALIGALTAARGQLPSLWWVAVIALSLCVPCFLFTILTRTVIVGADLPGFYAANIDRPAATAGLQLLADLNEYTDSDRRASVPRYRSLSLGTMLFMAGALFTAAFLARMSLVR
jgi:hypothetical protein